MDKKVELLRKAVNKSVNANRLAGVPDLPQADLTRAVAASLAAKPSAKGGRFAALEKLFLKRVAASEVYAELLTDLSVETGFDEDMLESAFVPMSICCWKVARGVIEETEYTSDVNKLREQVIDLQEKLTACNRTAMKSISNLRARIGNKPYFNDPNASPDAADGESTSISYHEPLAYLDDSTKDLVMSIVLDKVSQIANGDAPSSLIAKVVRAAEQAADVKNAEAARLAAVRSDGGDSTDEEKEPQMTKKEMGEAAQQTEDLRRQLEDAIQQTEAEEKKHCMDMSMQTEVIEQLEKALEEKTEVLAEATAKLEVLECDHCRLEMAKLGIHLGHKDCLTEEQARQRSEELAIARLQELVEADNAARARAKPPQSPRPVPRAPVDTKSKGMQTDMSGIYLSNFIDAAAGLQATCDALWQKLGEKTKEDDQSEEAQSYRLAARALKKAQSVFRRLWDDSLLRGQGLHDRARLPVGSKPVKNVLRAREFVRDDVIPKMGSFSGNVLQSVDEDLDSDEEDEPFQELGLRGVTLLSPRDKDGAKLQEEVREPISPKLDSWEIRRPTVILQGPKFARQDRKTVSLALLGPVARTTAEAQLQKQLFYSSPAEGVSDFLRQRRQGRHPDLPGSPSQPGLRPRSVSENDVVSQTTPVEKSPAKRYVLGQSASLPTLAQADPPPNSPKRYLLSRLEKSASLPQFTQAA